MAMATTSAASTPSRRVMISVCNMVASSPKPYCSAFSALCARERQLPFPIGRTCQALSSRNIIQTRERKSVTNKERLDQHDVEIAAIRRLIKKGMKLVVGTRQDIRLLAQDIRKL